MKLRLFIFILLSCAAATADTGTRFVVTGDSRGSSSGVNATILTEIVGATLDENAEFILFPGDLVMGSGNPAVLTAELLQWRDIMQPLYDSGVGVYPCRGNHDAGSKAAWDSVFPGPYALPANGPVGEENVTYSFTHDNIFVIALDQYVQFNRINQTWLDSQLAANTQPHVFVFGHAPAFKVHHWDCLDDHPTERNTFWSSIAVAGGRVYFCGHDHFYDHARLDDADGNPDNDVHQMIIGTAGAPPAADGPYNGNNGTWTPQRILHETPYGYILAEVDSASVTLTWKHRIAAGVYEAADVWTYLVTQDTCCIGIRGNADGDLSDQVDINDAVYLVAWLFQSGPPVPCFTEGDIDATGSIDVGDIVYIVSYLVFGGPPPVSCP